MRIGLITHNYPTQKGDRQNAGIFVYDLAKALEKRGHRVFVFCPDTSGQKGPDTVGVWWFDWLGRDKKLGDLSVKKLTDLVMLASLFWQGSREIVHFVGQNKIDFCMAMWAVPSGIFAWFAKQRTGVPFGIWALGSDVYVYAKYPILGDLIKKSLKSAAVLFADGIGLAQKVTGLTGRQCQFVPSATDLPSDSATDTYSTFGLPEAVKLMFLGRMEAVKGPDVLLDAIRRLSAENFELHFLGGGSQLETLKRQAEQGQFGDKVVFHDTVKDPGLIASFLKTTDWLIIPSRSDSIPLVFSEAVKAGVPLVVSQVGDMESLVKKYQLGFTFPKEDISALARILDKIISHNQKLRSQYAKKTALAAKLFNIDNSAEKLEREIASLS